ncbi:MAG: deoxyribonuclease IV [Candidatus Hodarchaeales archaeon]|jgi:deoxyribonuclease-4
MIDFPLGVHVSIKGGFDKAVDRAKSLNCTTFQIFTSSPRSWRTKPLISENVKLFSKKYRDEGFSQIYAHMPYLANFAASDLEIRTKSHNSFLTEVLRCDLLEIPFLIIHLGSHKGVGIKKGQENLVKMLEDVLEQEVKVRILLENSAGTKNSIGNTFSDLSTIIDNFSDPNKLGICLDTCHMFAVGYDLRSKEGIEKTLEEFDSLIGKSWLKVVHANDSKGELGSGIDRHEHIGMGYIGEKGFKYFFKSIKPCPIILETPIDKIRDDRGNLEKVRSLAGIK